MYLLDIGVLMFSCGTCQMVWNRGSKKNKRKYKKRMFAIVWFNNKGSWVIFMCWVVGCVYNDVVYVLDCD